MSSTSFSNILTLFCTMFIVFNEILCLFHFLNFLFCKVFRTVITYKIMWFRFWLNGNKLWDPFKTLMYVFFSLFSFEWKRNKERMKWVNFIIKRLINLKDFTKEVVFWKDLITNFSSRLLEMKSKDGVVWSVTSLFWTTDTDFRMLCRHSILLQFLVVYY